MKSHFKGFNVRSALDKWAPQLQARIADTDPQDTEGIEPNPQPYLKQLAAQIGSEFNSMMKTMNHEAEVTLRHELHSLHEDEFRFFIAMLRGLISKRAKFILVTSRSSWNAFVKTVPRNYC